MLLQIGTNDVAQSLDLTNAPTRLGALLDTITADAPKALVVVAQILPERTTDTDAAIEAYNAAIPGLVRERAAAGKHIITVNMYSAFKANPSYATEDFSDVFHPNAAGYTIMAKTWYQALAPILPK